MKARLKSNGTIWIVVVPDDDEAAVTDPGTGSGPGGNRPWKVIEFANLR
jgi:hypothetical protein